MTLTQIVYVAVAAAFGVLYVMYRLASRSAAQANKQILEDLLNTDLADAKRALAPATSEVEKLDKEREEAVKAYRDGLRSSGFVESSDGCWRPGSDQP